MHKSKQSAAVTLQLDMYKALDQPNTIRELFVKTATEQIQNIQYVQTRIIISHLPKEQKKKITDKMSEANMTLCQVAHNIALSTKNYRKKSLQEYVKMAVIPAELSYPEPDEPEILEHYLSNCLNRLTGLFVANKTLLAKDAGLCDKALTLLQQAKYYAKPI